MRDEQQRRAHLGALSERLDRVIGALMSTRWKPDGTIEEWSKTVDGMNFDRVTDALAELRKLRQDIWL